MSDALFGLDQIAMPPAGVTELVIRCLGEPQAQGNKTGFATFRKGADGGKVYTGQVAMREGKTAAARDRHKSWRGLVADAAIEAMGDGFGEPWLGPVLMQVTFTMKRPGSHYGTGRNAGVLKPTAPKWHTVRPDRGKLARSVEDSLKDAGVYKDDSQVCAGPSFKVYTRPASWPAFADAMPVPGVVIRLMRIGGSHV